MRPPIGGKLTLFSGMCVVVKDLIANYEIWLPRYLCGVGPLRSHDSHVQQYVCMYVCMYIHTYIHTYIHLSVEVRTEPVTILEKCW